MFISFNEKAILLQLLTNCGYYEQNCGYSKQPFKHVPKNYAAVLLHVVEVFCYLNFVFLFSYNNTKLR